VGQTITIRDEAFDSFAELNPIEQFGIAALYAPDKE